MDSSWQLKQDASDIYCYRYYNQGSERLQSAWFRWNIIGDLNYQDIMGDNWYGVVTKTDTGGTARVSLLNMDLSERFSTTDIEGAAFDYRVHMDYSFEIKAADLTLLMVLLPLLCLFLTLPMLTNMYASHLR